MGNCCFSSKHEDKQIIIPAHGDFLFQCSLTVTQGPFQLAMDLHLADPNIRTVTVTVRGVGIAPEGPKNDKPSS